MSVTSLLREQVVFRFCYLRSLVGWTKEPLIRSRSGTSKLFPDKGVPSNDLNCSLRFVASLFFLMDCLFGMLLWLFMSHSDNRQFCNETLINFTYAAMNVTRSRVQWLMGAPAGLKLNTPLTLFVGGHISGILDAWRVTFDTVAFGDFKEEFFAAVWLLFGIASLFGVSVQVALILDVMKVFVGYLLAFYNIFALLHSTQLAILFSLLRLFLGKKWNPLRQRIDSYEYDSSQLTIGTLLLSMSVFLFPTVAVYYALFLVLKFVLSVPRYFGRVGIVTINRFTILPLLVYAKWTTFKLSQTRLCLELASITTGEDDVDVNGSKKAEETSMPPSQLQESKSLYQRPQGRAQEQPRSTDNCSVELSEAFQDRKCTSKPSDQPSVAKKPPLLHDQQQQVHAIKVAHPMLPGQNIDLFQFQEHVKALGSVYVSEEYFVKGTYLKQLPKSISSTSALFYFTPSLFPRIIYLIKCSVMGTIFDF